MKKIDYIPEYYESNIEDGTLCIGDATNTIYYPVPELDGEFLVSTNGDPFTQYDLEEADNPEAEQELELIRKLIASGAGEDCNDEDADYIKSWLQAWGII